MKKFSLILVLLLGLTTAHAHEGHDHDKPAATPSVKGGVVKEIEKTRVEVVSRKNNIQIFLFDKTAATDAEKNKPVAVAGYKLTALAEHPRTKKQDPVELVAKGDFFEANYDAKGLHRYTLLLTIVDPRTQHNDKMSFIIEPKK